MTVGLPLLYARNFAVFSEKICHVFTESLCFGSLFCSMLFLIFKENTKTFVNDSGNTNVCVYLTATLELRCIFGIFRTRTSVPYLHLLCPKLAVKNRPLGTGGAHTWAFLTTPVPTSRTFLVQTRGVRSPNLIASDPNSSLRLTLLHSKIIPDIKN